jgi:hypothetical protein
MGNGKKAQMVQPWFPANDVEAEKAAQGEVYQGVDGQRYQHQDMPKASPKNPPDPVTPPAPSEPNPHATPPAMNESGPTVPELGPRGDDAPADSHIEPLKAPEPSPSFRPAIPGGPTNPSYDADKMDSTGKGEKDGAPVGPRGVNRPGDVMSDADRAQIAVKAEEKLRKGMSSTDSVDSIGTPKGSFETIDQGLNQHGMRNPDKVDFDSPVEAHQPMVGPRGKGVPKDTFSK